MMSDSDQLLQNIDEIYASSTDVDRLPQALEATSRLLDSPGATFEVIDLVSKRHTAFWSFGTPTHEGSRYLQDYATCNPRLPFTCCQPTGTVIWDYQFIDENEMESDPFYGEFLASLNLRYCTGAVIERTPEKLVIVSVQRTIKQGHVDDREIELMRRVAPHYQRAYDTSTRLRVASDQQSTLENALNWLADGVALLRADGTIAYANDTLCKYAERGDGFRIVGGVIDFTSPEARERFATAFRAACKVRDNALTEIPFYVDATDFPAQRGEGLPAYTIAVRLLAPKTDQQSRHPDAVALIFIRDPLGRNIAATQMLQALFNLTNAEAHLAQALCAGMTTNTYAITRRLSLNTVYTHLRRIREKTRCNSVAEMLRKFGEINLPLRLN
jgi:DNA-binding CsgD family transcriptional regulator/PAS domain-containing protein